METIRIPANWREKFKFSRIEQQAIGESRADVFRVRRGGSEDLFLKSEIIGPSSELTAEIERLQWLGEIGIPAPKVIDLMAENNRHWLLMSAIAGKDLASSEHLSPSQIVIIIATALQRLHQVDIDKCPFDHQLDLQLAGAQQRVDMGIVDESDFDEERRGRSADDLLAELMATRPGSSDLVVAHGDACLPNFMVDAGSFTGFIDCGRLGISDRYQDLALAARSIIRNLGLEWLAPFFRAYGLEPDHRRIAFYCLLDEFF